MTIWNSDADTNSDHKRIKINKISVQWKCKVHPIDHFLHSPSRDAIGYKNNFGHNGAAWERTSVHLFGTYSPFATLKWRRGTSRGLDPESTWAGSEDQGPNALCVMRLWERREYVPSAPAPPPFCLTALDVERCQEPPVTWEARHLSNPAKQ